MNPGAVSLVFGGPACAALAEAAGAVSARGAFPAGTATGFGASAVGTRRLARPWASAGLAAGLGGFIVCALLVPSADSAAAAGLLPNPARSFALLRLGSNNLYAV